MKGKEIYLTRERRRFSEAMMWSVEVGIQRRTDGSNHREDDLTRTSDASPELDWPAPPAIPPGITVDVDESLPRNSLVNLPLRIVDMRE